MNPMPLVRWIVASAALAVAGCAPSGLLTADAPSRASTVRVTVLHFNDVYEITPVEGGAAGGLARVAGLRRQLLAEDPGLITVLAGDFLSPSALGTARVDGERLAGRQMVAVLNALGLDAAALGNHEFDLSEEAFRQRSAEAAFPLVSANALAVGAAFRVAPRLVLPVAVAPGDTVRVGLASVVLPSNPKPWVRYLDADSTLRAEVARLDAEAAVVLGLTHHAFADDAAAAATIPGLDAILGGHEHENIRAYRGGRLVPVLKADGNARTVYVHRIDLDRQTGAVTVASELVPITPATPEDPATAAVVADWVERASAGFRADGFEPERVAVVTAEALDGRESTIRTRSTRLGTLIAEAFRRSSGAEIGLFNGGSVRIDDVIAAGPFTEYDAIRVLPFGGVVVEVHVAGDVLARVLDQGVANAGTGGFLQTSGVEGAPGAWRINGEPLDPARRYLVGTSDFLVSGRETGLGFFDAAANPDVEAVTEHGDVRRALLAELTRVYGEAR